MGTVAFNAARSESPPLSRPVHDGWLPPSYQTGDRFLRDHAEAMECRDCEDYLRLGVQAFNWLRTACRHIEDDILAGQAEYDEQLEQSITELYVNWRSRAMLPSSGPHNKKSAAHGRRRSPVPALPPRGQRRSSNSARWFMPHAGPGFMPPMSVPRRKIGSFSCSRSTVTYT